VETCGDSWKVVKSVLIFIYTPVISISLASQAKQAKYAESKTILLAIIVLPPTVALFVPYLLLLCSKMGSDAPDSRRYLTCAGASSFALFLLCFDGCGGRGTRSSVKEMTWEGRGATDRGSVNSSWQTAISFSPFVVPLLVITTIN